MIIHRYWTGDAPLPVTSFLAGYSATTMGHQVEDWTDDTIPYSILQILEDTAEYVPEISRIKHRSNVARLLLLQRFGGIWMDHDFVLFTTPLNLEPVVAAYSAAGKMCSCYMQFPAHHPLIDEAVAGIHPDSAAHLSSGESMLDKIFTSGVARLPLPYTLDRKNAIDLWGIHCFSSLTKEN